MHIVHRLHILHDGHPALLMTNLGYSQQEMTIVPKVRLYDFFFGQLVSIIYTLTSYWVVEGYPGEKKGRRGEGGREGGEEEREVGEMRHESEGKCMGRGEKGRRDHFIVPDHPLFVSGNHAWTSVISKLHTYCQFAVWKEGRMLIIMYTHVATPLNIRLGGKWPNTKLYYLRGRPW